jgi:hypothetical protein
MIGVGLWGATEWYSSSAGHVYQRGESLITMSFRHEAHYYDQVFYYGEDGKLISISHKNVPGCN